MKPEQSIGHLLGRTGRRNSGLEGLASVLMNLRQNDWPAHAGEHTSRDV